MRYYLFCFLFLFTACATIPQSEAGNWMVEASLPDLGAAPELTNDIWLNVSAPLRLADLRGKVVAIDMWTFG